MGTQSFWGMGRDLLQRVWYGTSTVLVVVLVFFIGWLIAKLVTPLLVKLFKKIKLDNLAEGCGLKNLLENGNITKPVSELLGLAVYWIMMLVVVFIALSMGNVAIPQDIIGQLLAFIPKFVVGVILFVLSMFLGKFFRGVIQTSAANAKIGNPGLLAKLTEAGIVVFGTVLALQIIGIAAAFISSVFNIILAAFCFGAALSFALGSKDLVREWLENLIKSNKPEKKEE
ncbi:MAG: hypothetical protein V2A65_00800 [Candidatus Omnitrophota bacterium]